ASKRTILGKKVTIRHISQTDEIKNSHVLFIGKMKDKEITAVLSFTRGKPILTVNDRKDGAEKGAIINFQVNKNKLGFEINENAAHRAGLVISSRMLRIATRIVDPLKKRD
ncbi:MAG: YfiR family protein, partial [Desulfobacterales bacterium]|nr:YfiR family protein [Desulfobacterales bacterium]